MENTKAALLMLLLLALSNITCSVDVAGFGSETTNGIVAGIVIDTSDNNGDNAIVSLFPAGFNPVTDESVGAVLIDTTDSTGSYGFTIKKTGTYTVHGVDRTSGRQLIHKYISIGKDTIRPVDTLKDPGFVRVMLPDTVDTTKGYIYIEGTGKSAAFACIDASCGAVAFTRFWSIHFLPAISRQCITAQPT